MTGKTLQYAFCKGTSYLDTLPLRLEGLPSTPLHLRWRLSRPTPPTSRSVDHVTLQLKDCTVRTSQATALCGVSDLESTGANTTVSVVPQRFWTVDPNSTMILYCALLVLLAFCYAANYAVHMKRTSIAVQGRQYS